ncbi:unnamed protein product [marine sediment metagenome]|uniref:Uncharacterized protein n=1 Tax=marine sediment metagenome TaxID=412755 RepID=X1QSY2_9ZZZZ
MEEEKKILLTGLTFEQHKTLFNITERGGDPPRRCYLCKRSENDKSLNIIYDNEEPTFSESDIVLHLITRKVENLTFHYNVCTDCAILLEIQSEEE